MRSRAWLSRRRRSRRSNRERVGTGPCLEFVPSPSVPARPARPAAVRRRSVERSPSVASARPGRAVSAHGRRRNLTAPLSLESLKRPFLDWAACPDWNRGRRAMSGPEDRLADIEARLEDLGVAALAILRRRAPRRAAAPRRRRPRTTQRRQVARDPRRPPDRARGSGGPKNCHRAWPCCRCAYSSA